MFTEPKGSTQENEAIRSRRRGRLLWPVLLAVALHPFAAISQDQEVDPEESVGLLRSWADSLEDQNKKLSTWQATFEVRGEAALAEDESSANLMKRVPALSGVPASSAWRQSFVNSVQFWWNAKEHALATKTRTLHRALLDPGSGEPLEFDHEGWRYNSFVYPDELVCYDTNRDMRSVRTVGEANVVPVRVAHTWPAANWEARAARLLFEPSTLFQTSDEFWNVLRNWAEIIEQAQVSGEVLQLDGERVRLVRRDTGEGERWCLITPGRSGEVKMLIELELQALPFPAVTAYREMDFDRRVASERRWRYRVAGGMLIPEWFEKKFYNEKGEALTATTYTLESSEVNGALPEDIFAYNRLGLRDGDRIRDHVRGTEYRYENGEAIPVKSLP